MPFIRSNWNDTLLFMTRNANNITIIGAGVCEDFPSSNIIYAAPEGYYAEGNAVIAVELSLTGEVIGEGDEEALAFDSILLTFLDGRQEVVNRPEDWNYDDWRGS